MMLNSLGTRQFAESVGKHTMRGQKGKLTRDKRLRSPAYGCRVLDKDTGLNREIAPDEVAMVLRIFEETALGHSPEQICRGLNEDGIPAPRGGKWFPTALRGTFDTPELKAEFTKALAKKRRKLERQNGTADIDRSKHKIATGDKARDNIMRAIAAGAPRESFRARWDAIEAAITETTARVRELEALQATGAAKVPRTAGEAWAAAIERQEALLGDPEVVHAAHQNLGRVDPMYQADTRPRRPGRPGPPHHSEPHRSGQFALGRRRARLVRRVLLRQTTIVS